MELYTKIRSTVIATLKQDLPPGLFYHSVEHTIDVETEAQRIAVSEQINDQHDLFLLKVACLYHDTGFLFTYKDHEIAGCNFAKKELHAFGFSEEQLEVICGMIMATRIPQTPNTKLEEIICDADLDYLGRSDFPEISNNLFLELKARNLVEHELDWNLIQTNFFRQHRYFTETNKVLREQQKQQYLQHIEALVHKEQRRSLL